MGGAHANAPNQLEILTRWTTYTKTEVEFPTSMLLQRRAGRRRVKTKQATRSCNELKLSFSNDRDQEESASVGSKARPRRPYELAKLKGRG